MCSQIKFGLSFNSGTLVHSPVSSNELSVYSWIENVSLMSSKSTLTCQIDLNCHDTFYYAVQRCDQFN